MLTRQRLVLNSFSGAMQMVVSMGLMLIAIPLFIHLKGSESYGLFSLVAVIGSLNSFTGLGLNSSLVRFLSAQGRCSESNYDIVVSSTILIAVLIPVTVAGVIFDGFVLQQILGVPPRLYDDARWLYIFFIISNSLLVLGQVPCAILDAGQRIYLTNLLQAAYNVVYWAGICTVLLLGVGLSGVGGAILLATLLWLIASVLWARRGWGSLSCTGLASNARRIMRKHLSFGLQIQSASVISFFYEPVTKILLSRYIGLTEVGFFDVALKIRGQVWGLINRLLYPFFPLISGIQERDRVRFIINDLEQKLMYAVIPMGVLTFFLAHPFLSAWLGSNVELISTTLKWVLVAHLLGVTVVPNYQYLMAKGHGLSMILMQLSNVVVNGLVFFITYSFLGYYAAVLANVAAILTSFTYSLYLQKRYLESLPLDSPVQAIKMLGVLAVNVMTLYLLSTLIGPTLWRLVAFPSAVLVASVLAYRYLSVFTIADISRYAGDGTVAQKWGKKLLSRKSEGLG